MNENQLDMLLMTEDSDRLNRNKYLFKNIDFMAKQIGSLEGDIVECGVWRGIMVTYMATVFTNRTIWAFDSFIGCPIDKSQVKYENTYATMGAQWSGLYAADESYLLKNLDLYNVINKDRVKIVKGWFKDTLKPDVCSIDKIAILRVDGDLYSSTMEVLDYLYPKVISGGFVIFDDFCIPASRQATMDYFAKIQQSPQFYNPLVEKEIHNTNGMENIQGVFIRK